MGKYTHLRDKYPRLPPDPSFEQVVGESKRLILEQADAARIHLTIGELGRRLYGLRQQKEALEDKIKDLNVGIEAYSALFINKADEQEIEGPVRVEGGASISIIDEPKLQVEDPQKFRQWCKDNDLEEALKMDWQTANALLKERLLEGQPEMDGCKAFFIKKLTVNKPRS